MKVILINKQKKIDLELNLFKKVSGYVADKFDSNKNTELNIIFVDKDEISHLNQKYRKVAGPTDVLSFSYKNTNNSENFQEVLSQEGMTKNYGFYVVGEVIICPEIALENVANNKSFAVPAGISDKKKGSLFNKEQEWDLCREIILLIIHGILHLYDYDHEKVQDFEAMENIQNTILNDVVLNYLT